MSVPFDINMLGGFRIIESALLTEPFEDWSQVRSHGRARRRLKQGHPQRVRYIQVPSKNAYRIGSDIVMHPVMARELRRSFKQEGSV